jgi:hypothetical protein
MNKSIREFLLEELKSNNSRRIMHEHFYLLKNVKGNRIDFQFLNPKTNERFAYFSISCHGNDLKFHSNINNESFYQKTIFDMFIDSAKNIIKQQKRAIIKTINKNQMFF